MADNFDAAFQKTLHNLKKIGYIKPEVIDKYAEEIREDFIRLYINRVKPFNKIIRFYIFLLEEAIRKYFMREIRIERHYVDTRVPYFDEEFLELIFQTSFAGIYRGKGKTDIFSRRNIQLFYAKAIQANNPKLNDIITDRGYKSKDLLLPFILRAFKVGPPYLKERIEAKIKGDDTFNPEWPTAMVKKYIYKISPEDNIFTDKLLMKFKEGINFKNDFRFFSIFSLRLWLYLLNNKII
jgi:hypothetical protein